MKARLCGSRISISRYRRIVIADRPYLPRDAARLPFIARAGQIRNLPILQTGDLIVFLAWLIGLDADLVGAAFSCIGVPFEFKTGSWSGLLPSVIVGQADLMWSNLY